MLRFLSYLSLIISSALYPSVSSAKTGDKPTIVLVHGAFEDASVWNKTREILERQGYKTAAVDLPGRPSAPASNVAPDLAVYRDTVLTAIKDNKDPVILVGHSFGGITISNVAEAAPEKIKTAIYLAAYLPRSGESLVDLSQRDSGSAAGPAFRIDGAKGIASIAMEARADLFCNDCPPDVATAMPATMVDEPLAPLATPVTLTAEKFGKVDKAYIRTSKDRVVSPVLQTAMLEATPVREQVTLDTGHAPFLSNPAALAAAIIEAID